jgi:copper(I)-binding protein
MAAARLGTGCLDICGSHAVDASGRAAYTSAMAIHNMLTGLLTAGVLALSASAIPAKDFKLGPLEIKNPWMPATPKGAPVAGGYMTIVNSGTTPDRLIGGSSPIAGRFELHRMTIDQGVMRMRPVTGGLEIKPGQTVEFKPGSLHVMFVGLKEPLEKGRSIKGTLVFEKAGMVEIEYSVEAIGGRSSPRSGHAH